MEGYEKYITAYGLKPHPEGGYYAETYRSEMMIDEDANRHGFNGQRRISTAIYFLLPSHSFSAFHRIKSDEIWHFYDGDSVAIHMIHENGAYEQVMLGRSIEENQLFQFTVKAGIWFAAQSIPNSNGFTLVGCTVSPGFDFKDFELASKENLLAEFPQHKTLIHTFCRY